jgi:hypothetical protein
MRPNASPSDTFETRRAAAATHAERHASLVLMNCTALPTWTVSKSWRAPSLPGLPGWVSLVRGSQSVFAHLGDQESSLRTDNRPSFDQSLVDHGPEVGHDVEDTEYRLFSFNPPQEFLLLEIEPAWRTLFRTNEAVETWLTES